MAGGSRSIYPFGMPGGMNNYSPRQVRLWMAHLIEVPTKEGRLNRA